MDSGCLQVEFFGAQIELATSFLEQYIYLRKNSWQTNYGSSDLVFGNDFLENEWSQPVTSEKTNSIFWQW